MLCVCVYMCVHVCTRHDFSVIPLDYTVKTTLSGSSDSDVCLFVPKVNAMAVKKIQCKLNNCTFMLSQSQPDRTKSS